MKIKKPPASYRFLHFYILFIYPYSGLIYPCIYLLTYQSIYLFLCVIYIVYCKSGSPNRMRWLGIRPRSGLWKRKSGRMGRKIKKPPPAVNT